MALPWREGNRRKPVFPRLLLGLSAKLNLDRESAVQQRLDLLVEFLEGNFSFEMKRISSSGAD